VTSAIQLFRRAAVYFANRLRQYYPNCPAETIRDGSPGAHGVNPRPWHNTAKKNRWLRPAVSTFVQEPVRHFATLNRLLKTPAARKMTALKQCVIVKTSSPFFAGSGFQTALNFTFSVTMHLDQFLSSDHMPALMRGVVSRIKARQGEGFAVGVRLCGGHWTVGGKPACSARNVVASNAGDLRRGGARRQRVSGNSCHSRIIQMERAHD
jgi:hypothetical protein